MFFPSQASGERLIWSLEDTSVFQALKEKDLQTIVVFMGCVGAVTCGKLEETSIQPWSVAETTMSDVNRDLHESSYVPCPCA
jgi:hypothetical protein